jgi:hypothetical protein
VVRDRHDVAQEFRPGRIRILFPLSGMRGSRRRRNSGLNDRITSARPAVSLRACSAARSFGATASSMTRGGVQINLLGQVGDRLIGVARRVADAACQLSGQPWARRPVGPSRDTTPRWCTVSSRWVGVESVRPLSAVSLEPLA